MEFFFITLNKQKQKLIKYEKKYDNLVCIGYYKSHTSDYIIKKEERKKKNTLLKRRLSQTKHASPFIEKNRNFTLIYLL